jgi:hypothetical protein
MFVKINHGIYRGQAVNGVFPLYQAPVNAADLRVKIFASTKGTLFQTTKPKINLESLSDIEFYFDSTCQQPATHVDAIRFIPSVAIADVIEQIPIIGNANAGNSTASSNDAMQVLKSMNVGNNTMLESWIDAEKVFRENETEEEAIERIRSTFAELKTIVEMVAENEIRGLIISGPPGVGKSWDVTEALDVYCTHDKLKGVANVEVVSGMTTPLSMYMKLHEFKDPGQVLVFDDCDSVLYDEDSLNILKAALDSRETRVISWNTTSRKLEKEDVPHRFQYQGSIIFITNVKLDNVRKESRLRLHLEAILSRCMYYEMTMGATSDILLRIKQVMQDGMLAKYKLPEDGNEIIYKYIVDNKNDLHELSLRMITKIADLMSSKPDKWESLVESLCMKKEARFRRMMARSIQKTTT